MAETTTPADPPPAAPTPPQPASDNALRVVLFGMPAAGKSSLLGAVAQAAQTQEHLLNGRLTDRSHGLADLQRRVYEEKSRPTAEEVVPYLVDFEPFAADHQTKGTKVEAVLIDCDGRVANDLLARRRTLRDDSPDGTLAREVLDADTLVLAIDAAAPASQVEADFAEFGRFLRLLERSRGQASEVGGLPVFLVLTKCDLLAGPDDSASDWLERVEERKRQVAARFRDFLSRQLAEGGPLPFGQIELHVWATAVKRPALGPAPAKPREPYGVGELLRQALENAEVFRRRSRQSSRRLLLTVGGAMLTAAVMVAASVALFLWGPQHRPTKLQNDVEGYRSLERPTPSDRLRGDLEREISILADFKNNPDFSKMPPDLRTFVDQRLKEFKDYRDFRDRLTQLDRGFATILSEDDLKSVGDQLKRLTVPPEHEKDWQNTEAVRRRQDRLEDVELARKAVGTVAGWYEGLTRDGNALLAEVANKADFDMRKWADKVERLLEQADLVEARKKDPIPGSSLAYGVVARFPTVADAQARWDAVRKRLEQSRKMGAALGLIEGLAAYPPMLVIDPQKFSFSDAGTRLNDLRRAYRNPAEDFSLKDVPPALASRFRQEAGVNYGRLLEVARREIDYELQVLAGNNFQETPTLWAKLRTWLETPATFASWRPLAESLGKLASPDWTDPVEELATFLRRDKFELDLTKVVLEIQGDGLKPAGQLLIFHPRTKSDGPALTFEMTEAGVGPDGKASRYAGKLKSEGRVLFYQPGDTLLAAMDIFKDNSKGWRLTWSPSQARSAMYQFECLSRPPLLHPTGDDPSTGTPAKDVTLAFTPPVPPVPELMPDVFSRRR